MVIFTVALPLIATGIARHVSAARMKAKTQN
jgi:spermidine/putrescine transport system permease protein